MTLIIYVVHHSSGRLATTSPTAGMISGLTFIDFLALPSKARVAITINDHNSDDDFAEAFIGLKYLGLKG